MRASLQLAITVICLVHFLHYVRCVILQTRLGPIEGVETNLMDAGSVFSFRQIPYAKPPLGDLRFRKPVPYGAWNSTLKATEYGPSCIQLSQLSLNPRPVSEDCLHLNILVPYRLQADKRRAVMIWVHGGSYKYGEGSSHDGTKLALLGDVIFVSINYRLGPLGFFSTGDDASPGNYGLWDQHLAFRWVHENIADYGGDSDSVTIFGESAGGGSVSFQSLYPGNRGLFQRVIPQSGVATSYLLRANQQMIKEDAKLLFREVNCSSPNRMLAMDCLRRVPEAHFIRLIEYVRSSVVIDNEFVTGVAEEILANRNSEAFKFFSSLDYMVGSLDGDGGVVLNLYAFFGNFSASLRQGVTHDQLCNAILPFISGNVVPHDNKIRQQVCELYKNDSSTDFQSNTVVDMLTDVGFTYPAIRSADFHASSKGATYVYLMTRVTPLQVSVYPSWTHPWMDRMSHAMDVIYMFNSSLFVQMHDIAFADKLLGYWTNFAKTGDPNGPGLSPWPKYNEKRKIQIIDVPMETAMDLFPSRSKLWLDTIPDFLSKDKAKTKGGPSNVACRLCVLPFVLTCAAMITLFSSFFW